MSTTAKKKPRRQSFPMKVKSGAVVVKIYRSSTTRTEKGFLYQVAWHDGTARRVKQFADLKKAKAEAKLMAGELQAGRVHHQKAISTADLDELTSIRREAGEHKAIEIIRKNTHRK